jgi:hypothetical protein
MRVFKSRMLRKAYVSEGEEVAGGWNRLYSEEITDLHRLLICTAHQIFLGDQMKNNEMGEACSKYGGEESFIQGSDGETCRRE